MGFFSSIATPAVVAGFISLLVTNRNEKVRAQRDFLTKAFDPARDTIKSAVDAAIDYFPLEAANRTKLLEARILASEREARRSISALLSLHAGNQPASYGLVQEAYDDFIDKLTSGNFQEVKAASDVGTSLKIADAGAKLRAALLTLRSEALERAITNDPLSSIPALWSGILRYTGLRN